MLAMVHLTPTQWYKDFKSSITQKFPILNTVSDGSHIWTYLNKPMAEYFNIILNEDNKDIFLKEFEPLSPAAKKIVTTHGDFCPTSIFQVEKYDYEKLVEVSKIEKIDVPEK